MRHILDLRDVRGDSSDFVGGKAASLSELMGFGMPVPPGFVVSTEAFEEFLKDHDLTQEIDAQLRKIDHNSVHTIESASEAIQSLIREKDFTPEFEAEIRKQFSTLGATLVAVRSSATAEDGKDHAWAGQLDSFLNTTEEHLFDRIKECWASLFTPRALYYRFEKGLHESHISIAVVVQAMIESEKSGIAFSVHPITEDPDQLIIEAGFGLGEAIVSGSVTPDSYVVKKSTGDIIDTNVHVQNRALRRGENGNEWQDLGETGSSQVLDEVSIKKLADLIIKIEEHYGSPQDIEWAYAGGTFYITQSRPITTLEITKAKNNAGGIIEYQHHFTVSEFSILTLDSIFSDNEAYGAVDYVVFYENDIARAYLSPKGVKECYDISTRLLEDDFVNDLLTRSERVDKVLKSYHIDDIDERNLDNEWKKATHLANSFSKSYIFFEQPFQQALEQEILKKLTKNELVEILSHGDLNSLPDIETRKYVERLISMGKMKLRLHEDSEKFFSDDTFLKYVSEKHRLTYVQIGAMRVVEFENALRGELTVSTDVLNERLEGSVLVKENEKWCLYTGEQYNDWKNKVQKVCSGDVVGDVAFAGIANGPVVIHLSWTGVTELNDGDILVTGMTNPQMIPMLKKASAIVTDEGGITCHAAIISRELRKPCIVGTRNATQVLRDGDLVKVDANVGSVTIIKK